MKKILLFFLIVVIVFSLTSCSKLNKEQQSWVDNFFAQREVWEKAGSLYCIQLNLYKARGGDGIIITCVYAKKPLTHEKVQSYIIAGMRSCLVTADGVTPEEEVANGLFPGESRLVDASEPIYLPKQLGWTSYHYGDSDKDKKKAIAGLVLQYES